MHRNRRAAVATIASLLLCAGVFVAFTLSGGSARADDAGSCSANPQASPGCTDVQSFGAAVSSQIVITASANISASASPVLTGTATANPTAGTSYPLNWTWTSNCQTSGTNRSVTKSDTTDTLTYGSSKVLNVDLGFGGSPVDSCVVSVTAKLTGPGNVPIALNVDIVFVPNTTTSASPTPSASSTTASHTYNQVSGFDGKCLNDAGNSSVERAKVQIWSCNDTYASQSWSYSGSELHHGSMCLNAKGSNPRKGAVVMLWPCNSAANEIWIHKSNGEYVLKADGYHMCLNDPGYATRNGTQLIVWTCVNSPNEHWGLP
jgi:Ricin-type beta-trefoil lectin domain